MSFLKSFYPSQATHQCQYSRLSICSILDWVFAWGHPFGGHRIMKQGVFKVDTVSSPQTPFFLLQILPFSNSSTLWLDESCNRDISTKIWYRYMCNLVSHLVGLDLWEKKKCIESLNCWFRAVWKLLYCFIAQDSEGEFRYLKAWKLKISSKSEYLKV